MGPLDFAIHLLSFAAPALAVTLLVALAARVLWPGPPVGDSWWVPVAINFIAGTAALIGGLRYFGTDGKMATYGAMVVVIATGQWISSRAWR